MARYIDRPTLHPKGFSAQTALPYDLRAAEVRAAMDDLYDFLYNVNTFLTSRGYERMEELLAGAVYSGVVSELVVQSLSKQSVTLTANQWHNGRPDLVPTGLYGDTGILRGEEGVEVKASRHESGWQGHNPETGWIMIFQYRIDLITDPVEARDPTIFERVLCAYLDEADWSFSGRSGASRRTITASIRKSGTEKLRANPVYLDPDYAQHRRRQRR
jgi:hypothetical protein